MADASIWQPGSDVPLVNSENSAVFQAFVATAAQTVFALTEFTYSLGTNSLQVFVNGVAQIPVRDFTETSSTSFTLTFAADVNDDVVAWGLVGSTNTDAAAISATNAAASAAAASVSAASALASEVSATASESSATSSASAASASAASAAASYDSFDDRYLGAKAVAPTLDNDGNALVTGALYWDTAVTRMFAWTGTAWSSSSSLDGTVAGNLNFTGVGNRITGDFSNATASSRVMFQTSTASSATVIGAIPSVGGTQSNLSLYNTSTPTAAGLFNFKINATESRIETTHAGASYLPMTFFTGGLEAMRIDTSGNLTFPIGSVLLTGSASVGLGYGTGAGGTVTQATSKATAVTLNKPTGQITLDTATLNAGATVSFLVNSSTVGITVNDMAVVSMYGGSGTAGAYSFSSECQTNAIRITIRNNSASNLSEGFLINFAIIKGATS
jgi:hypothetical protein